MPVDIFTGGYDYDQTLTSRREPESLECGGYRTRDYIMTVPKDSYITCQAVSRRASMSCNVPTTLKDRIVFSIGEALSKAGVSRSTYFRWVRSGRIPDTQFKDRNGHRVFTEEEIRILDNFANQLRDSNAQIRLEF